MITINAKLTYHAFQRLQERLNYNGNIEDAIKILNSEFNRCIVSYNSLYYPGYCVEFIYKNIDNVYLCTTLVTRKQLSERVNKRIKKVYEDINWII